MRISDGLGNQLYQYATGLAVAKMNKEELVLDISDAKNSTLRDYMLDQFCIDPCKTLYFPNGNFFQKLYTKLHHKLCYDMFEEKIVTEKNGWFNEYDPKVIEPSKGKPKYMAGYWQNHRYFDDYMEDIRRQFQPAAGFSDRVKELRQQFAAGDTCGIHIRCGDIPPKKAGYFTAAIKKMEELQSPKEYIVFTNDEKAAAEVLNEFQINYRMISSYGEFTDVEEFFLLSSCTHFIIANSSYSLWATYLNENNDKTVIVPYKAEWEDGYYYKDWVIIPPEAEGE